MPDSHPLEEQLVSGIKFEEEADLPEICPDPLSVIIEVLKNTPAMTMLLKTCRIYS
ncbi:hypothetical protein [Methanohalophilus sp.]